LNLFERVGAMRSLTLTIVLAVALAVSATGCSKKGTGGSGKADSASAAKKESAGKVVVKVDGKPLTLLDVQRQEDMLAQQLQQYADSAQLAAMKPNIRRQALENAINRVLLEDTIKRLGIKAEKKTVDERADMFRKNFVSDEAFNAELVKRGLTADQLKHEIELGAQAEEFFNKRTANIKPVTEQDARTFYDNNEQRFVQPERVHASHILIGVNKDDADSTRTRKKADAQRILRELKKGADFAEEARKYSGDPNKTQGGDLGYFERGRMVPEFEKAAFALKSGQMSGVVETPLGYHIIKVIDHAKASTVPFDQAKQNIEQYLGNQKKQQAITSYFDSLRSVSKIQYVDTTFLH
jgi:peptidyl-prolyl cis-trans isomerase C